jgi:hypothetical protein
MEWGGGREGGKDTEKDLISEMDEREEREKYRWGVFVTRVWGIVVDMFLTVP